jgi:hypothetical protein
MNRALYLFATLTVLCTPVLAGITDLGNELPGFTGMREFRATYSNGTHLDVNVEFAVFAPNNTDLMLNSFAGLAAPSTSQYLYAFQLKSLNSSTVPLSRLTIDLPALANVTGVGYSAIEGVRNASSATLRPEYLRFNFTSGKQLGRGESSYFLLFSSPNAPTWANASIIDGGTSQTVPNGLPAPSPVPTPTAVLLGVIGLAGVHAARRLLS